jgi:uncharacterized membrane-anchored protein
MKRWWLWILMLHLGFFGAWTALEEWRQTRAQVFLLETEGADPRDLWAGQYLGLAYPVARVDASLPGWGEGVKLAIKLDAVGDTVVAGQTWPLRRSTRHAAVPTGDYTGYPAEEGWARGQLRQGRAVLGIERYYFNEAREDELRKLVPGRYFALVRLSPDGRLRVQRLVW